MFSSYSVRRAKTRRRFPSTEGITSPKAMEAMASDVYRPIPAKFCNSLEHLFAEMKDQADFFFRICQGFYIGQCCQKTFVIGDYGIHPCLLQHDLRDPHMIGCGILPPGKDAPPGVVPLEQKLRIQL